MSIIVIEGFVTQSTRDELADFLQLVTDYDQYGVLCDPFVYLNQSETVLTVHTLELLIFYSQSNVYPHNISLHLIQDEDVVEYHKEYLTVELRYSYQPKNKST